MTGKGITRKTVVIELEVDEAKQLLRVLEWAYQKIDYDILRVIQGSIGAIKNGLAEVGER